MGSLGIEGLNGIEEVNFQGSRLGEIDIGEMATDVETDQMEGGLNEVVSDINIC